MWKFFFSFYLFLSLFVWASAADQIKTNQVVKIRADAWCPFTCDNSEKPGFIVEVIQKALGRKGYFVDFKILNWARAIKDTRQGVYTGLAGAAHADAPDFIFHKTPIDRVKFELFALKDSSWRYKDSLAGRRVGVINGYAYDHEVNQLIQNKDPSIVMVSGTAGLGSLIEMLKARRIDAIYENADVLAFWSQQQDKKNKVELVNVGSPMKGEQEIFVALSPRDRNSPQYAQWIEYEIQLLQQNGEWKKLKEKYKMRDR